MSERQLMLTRVLNLAVLISVSVVPGYSQAKADVKTLKYYSEHGKEANAVSAECRRKWADELSILNSTEKQKWWDSEEGINCKNALQAQKNARQASAAAGLSEYQRRLRESAEKFGK